MITTDLHAHTLYSHAADTVSDMAEAAERAGMTVFGFSEHSPRPEGCGYNLEYRDRLDAGFPRYLEEVKALRHRKGSTEFLLGLEVDWIEGEHEYITGLAAAEDYDYLLGSVHFVKGWPMDGDPDSWEELDEAERFVKYAEYFGALRHMAESRLMHIAAHPDLVKIYSVDTFHKWLHGPNMELVRAALAAMRDSGMSMEVSAAGLRKMCGEIYPCPLMMEMARDMGLPISFASDSHAVGHVGWKFEELAIYGRAFGFTTTRYYKHRRPVDVEF